MTDDVRQRFGNAEMVEGKSAFVKLFQLVDGSVSDFRTDIDATPVYA